MIKIPSTKYDKTKQCDLQRVKDITSAQDILPIISIDRNGIFELPEKRYSKQYILSDINFAGMTEDEKRQIIINYASVLKAMPCRFQITVANEAVDVNEFSDKILYKYRNDGFDDLRKAYNDVITDKVSDAKQGLYQSIYITLTVNADSIKDASDSFFSMESAIRNAFINIGVSGVSGSKMQALGINKRINMLSRFFHYGIKGGRDFDFSRDLTHLRDFHNAITPYEIEFLNDSFKLNGHLGKTFVIKFPNVLESDMIALFSNINCTSFISINSELIDTGAFKQEVNRKYMSIGMKIENQKQRNRNNNDFLSDASEKLLNEKGKLDEMTRAIDEDDEHYYNTTLLITLVASDEESMRKAEEKLNNSVSIRSADIKPCFAKQKEALISSLPFGSQEFKKVTNLSSSNLAMLMPFKTQELNDDNGVYYGINQLSRNAIKADKKLLKNHNGLIFGQSGSGKSVFAKSEMMSMFVNNPDDQFIVIDPQSEYWKVAEKLKGTVVSFDSTKAFYINPMDVDYTGADYSGLREIIADKSDFILTLLSACLKSDLSPEDQGIIDNVIEKVYSENYSLRKRLNGESVGTTEYDVPEYLKGDTLSALDTTDLSVDEQIRKFSPTLQDVYQGLLEEGSKNARHLASAMDVFVNGSLNLFNHRTNVDLKSRFIVFDISGLKDNLRTTAMLIMMETVHEKIKSNSKNGKWTHLYIDEFHELLNIPQVADFVLKLWKEIRKMSGILNGITQNMSDLMQNSESGSRLQAILSNTEYFALLSQSSTDKRALMDFLPSISAGMFSFVDNADSGTGLLKMGSVTIPFDFRMSSDSPIYKMINTDSGQEGSNVSV